MSPATEPFRLRDIAVAAYGPSVVTSIGHGAVMPVLALRARDLGADVGTAALVVGLLGVGMLVTSLPAGAVIARIGEKRALQVAGVVDAAAMAAAALTHSVLALGVAVAVSGMAWTTFLIARQGFMIEAVPAQYRARALSTLGGTYRIGIFLGPLIGAGLISWAGLTGVFWLALAMSLGPPGWPAWSRTSAPRAGPPSVGPATCPCGPCSPPSAGRSRPSGPRSS
jgi:MFS family permease